MTRSLAATGDMPNRRLEYLMSLHCPKCDATMLEKGAFMWCPRCGSLRETGVTLQIPQLPHVALQLVHTPPQSDLYPIVRERVRACCVVLTREPEPEDA